jgi:hypothetical protein
VEFFNFTKQDKPFLKTLLLFLLCIIVELIFIFILNSNYLVYTLDDSYIHLALAENIYKDHYGINLQEYSSPSSSILWPFLLAPFSGSNFGYYVPFIINVLSAVGTILVLWLLIKLIFLPQLSGDAKTSKITFLFLILLVLATNLIASVFSGMEHSLQLFFTVLIIRGLVIEIQEKRIPKLLLAAIIIAPLIRYENLALSFASLLFLYLRGQKKIAILSFALIALLMCTFSVFLLNLGLEPLPLSILEKSSVVSTGGSIYSILANLKKNVLEPRGILLLIGFLFLLYMSFFSKRGRDEKLISGCIAFAILIHLLAGKSNRYIVYIWSASILTSIFLNREKLIKIIKGNSFFKITAFASIITILLCYNYIYSIFIVPLASNNIYEQQYQMHRFAVDYYKKPVAVNDLGFVAYKNDNYVLDLVGLASLEVQKQKRYSKTPEWMDTLTSKHNVKLAMIYDRWFPQVPGNWNKIAKLYLGKEKFTPAENVVSFYLIDKESTKEVNDMLNKFRETLPEGVKLITVK